MDPSLLANQSSDNNADCAQSNFDDWKWATEQRCILIEMSSYKIPSLDGTVKTPPCLKQIDRN